MTINFDGNIGKDAELRTVKIGEDEVKVLSVMVAENKTKKDGSKKTLWHKVTIWRKYAETMAEYLKAGRHVLVEGDAEAKFYTNKNQQIVPYIDVQATKIRLLDSKRDEEPVPDIADLDEAWVN